MSNSVAEAYADAVKQNQKVMYAVWEPGRPMKLGDYGVMRGNIFVPMGHISELEELKDFTINYVSDNSVDEKFFTSTRDIQFELKAKATVNGVPVNASIDISSSKENSVFFNAAGCKQDMIENKYQLGQKLLEIYKKNSHVWKKEFVVVTDLVSAERGLIIISNSSDFSISLEADASVAQIDLSQASLNLTVRSQRSSCYKLITEQTFFPLIGLGKIQSSFLWFNDDFKPMALQLPHAAVEALKNADEVKTEASAKDVHFGQYTDDLA